jgi:hypothetical protein
MAHSSNPFIGKHTRGDDEKTVQNVVRINSHITIAVSQPLKEEQLKGHNVVDARSLFAEIAAVRAQERRDIPKTADCSELAEDTAANEIAWEIAQFCDQAGEILRADPSLLPLAWEILETIQDFLDVCDIGSPIPLEERFDEDEHWRYLMRCTEGRPTERNLAIVIREDVLEDARAHFAWLLSRGWPA